MTRGSHSHRGVRWPRLPERPHSPSSSHLHFTGNCSGEPRAKKSKAVKLHTQGLHPSTQGPRRGSHVSPHTWSLVDLPRHVYHGLPPSSR